MPGCPLWAIHLWWTPLTCCTRWVAILRPATSQSMWPQRSFTLVLLSAMLSAPLYTRPQWCALVPIAWLLLGCFRNSDGLVFLKWCVPVAKFSQLISYITC